MKNNENNKRQDTSQMFKYNVLNIEERFEHGRLDISDISDTSDPNTV